MNDQDLVRRFCAACENGDVDTLNGILGDDFTFRHPEGAVTADKAAFIDIMRSMNAAFPDLRFDLQNLEEGPRVRGQVQLSGTHEGTFVVPEGPTVPATGKRFELPPEWASWECEGGVITGHSVEPTEGGGLPGIMGQLGVELPPPNP